MKITIVTVCLNSESTIEWALESIAAQSYKNLEHIVVDGGSKDATVTLIHGWKKHPVRLISERDKGIFDAMNKGIALATGDVVGILNSDDAYYDRDILKKVAKTMNAPSVDACYADLIYVEKNNLHKIFRYWKASPFEKGLFRKGWVPPHPTFFVHRRIYEKYGLFDLDYSLAADFELMARFLERFQIKATYIPQIFVKMCSGGVSNKSLFNIIRQNFEIYQAIKKNNLRFYFFPFVFTKLISRLRQYFSKPSASDR